MGCQRMANASPFLSRGQQENSVELWRGIISLLEHSLRANPAGGLHGCPCGARDAGVAPWRYVGGTTVLLRRSSEDVPVAPPGGASNLLLPDRKSTRLNSRHLGISYAVV